MELLVFLHKINLFFSQTSILLSKKQSSDTFGGKSIVKTTNKSQLFMISLPSLTTRLRNSLHSSATGRFITFRHSRLVCVGQFGIPSSGAARCSIPIRHQRSWSLKDTWPLKGLGTGNTSWWANVSQTTLEQGLAHKGRPTGVVLDRCFTWRWDHKEVWQPRSLPHFATQSGNTLFIWKRKYYLPLGRTKISGIWDKYAFLFRRRGSFRLSCHSRDRVCLRGGKPSQNWCSCLFYPRHWRSFGRCYRLCRWITEARLWSLWGVVSVWHQ